VRNRGPWQDEGAAGHDLGELVLGGVGDGATDPVDPVPAPQAATTTAIIARNASAARSQPAIRLAPALRLVAFPVKGAPDELRQVECTGGRGVVLAEPLHRHRLEVPSAWAVAMIWSIGS